MISVGIDVSKGKSTVCILKPYGEVLCRPFDVSHITDEMGALADMLSKFDDDIKIVMEATGIYHLPVLLYLKEKQFFVSVINPYEMKQYRMRGLRGGKTDKRDSISIANYGIDNWYHLKEYQADEAVYSELKLLGRQYSHYMKLHIDSLHELTHLLDYTMPDIKRLLGSWDENSGKDKLGDFAAEFWHYDNITKFSEEEFTEKYKIWAKEKKYHQSQSKAQEIYKLALMSIPTLPSNSETTKLLVQEAVRVLKEVDNTLKLILTQMQELAKALPEYSVVRSMNSVGNVLAPKLIAEIGDVRRFHSGKALIAYAGIDAPPYQSGKFIGTNRKISKRGSALLRKIGYETMRCIKTHPNLNDPVYCFMIKKEQEGKSKKAAKIAGLNKFLRIYYARFKEVYQE